MHRERVIYMAIKVGMVSLGCAKNQVDGEMLMANLKNAGFELCDDAALADVAIVNTCGFIDSAKQESIDEILELTTLKKEGRIKKIVVTGCLAERYREEIHKELPEVDGVFGIGANADIAACIESAMNDFTESFPEKSKMPLCGERELSTPSYFAYIKIAEGCDNKCTYCAIPMIRGATAAARWRASRKKRAVSLKTARRSSSSLRRTRPATALTCTANIPLQS